MTSQYIEEEEFTTEFSGKTIRRILSLTSPYKLWVIGFLVTIAIVSGMDSYFTYLSKGIVDEGIIKANLEALTRIIIIYGSLIIAQSVFVFGFIYLAGVLGERIRYDLRRKMFNHLQELSLTYYNLTPVGWIMSRVTSDTDRVAELVTWGLLDTTWAVFNISTAAFFMLIINWKLAIIVLTLVPILVYVAILFRKKILVQFRLVRKFNSKITGAFNETITGVRVVKALNQEKENLQDFKSLTSDMYRAGYRAAWLSALFLPTVQLISAFALGAIVWFGGLQNQYGAMTIGGIQAFVSYITFMMWPIRDLARVYAELQHAVASAERMFSLIDSVPNIQDIDGAVDPGTIKGTIEFDHIHFAYEDGNPVLTDFNLCIQQGEKIALVGPTGGGKTTIVNLLCRFFEPTKGQIRIGGHDYTKLSLYSIQSRIGIVLQSPHLFSGSIRENIRYGRLNASDEEIEEAAKVANAHEFIKNLDNQYEEEVGEKGDLLSTGQKQLISLARAVLADPEVFIMDEATSSVDTLTEALIQNGMENIMKNRTSVLIAHRLSTIRKADRIIVIDEGRISEIGTHSELLRNKGHYYNLYTQQFRKELEQEFHPIQEKNTALNNPALDT